MSQSADTSRRAGRSRSRKLRIVPRSRRGRLIAASALVLVVAGAATGAWFLLSRPSTTAQGVTQTLTVSPTTLKTTVSATGTLEPERQANLTFDAASTVSAVDVAVGDTVSAGQHLASIDDTALQLALDSARADLTAATESLSDLEDSDDASASAIAAAKAGVQVKSNAVTQAETNLEAATMTAPFDGIIAEVNVAVGDSTSAGSGAQSGGSANVAAGAAAQSTSSAAGAESASSSAAVVLLSKDSYTVSTSVSSGDIASVKRGLQAELTVAGAEDTLYGTVASVAVAATSSSSGTASFPVEIDVTGTQEGLFAGSSVTVEIVTSQLTDVIAVPSSAITLADGVSTVTKLVDGVETPTQITVGDTVDGMVVVSDGLADGDQIVVTMTLPGDGSGERPAQGEGGFPGGELPFEGGQLPGGGRLPGNGSPPSGADQGGQGGGPNR